jgi:transcription elongation GreA/GreB family factor
MTRISRICWRLKPAKSGRSHLDDPCSLDHQLKIASDGDRRTAGAANPVCEPRDGMPEKTIISTVSAWELGEKFETTRASKNEALREARIAKLDGDLSENAPYQAAKEKFRTMGRIQRRITNEMNELIERGHTVVDPLSWAKEGQVQEVELGTVVELEQNGEPRLILVAGARDHHFPAEGNIMPVPYNSPLGKLLLQRRAGERFTAMINGNNFTLTIIMVRWPTRDEIFQIFPAIRKGSFQS